MIVKVQMIETDIPLFLPQGSILSAPAGQQDGPALAPHGGRQALLWPGHAPGKGAK